MLHDKVIRRELRVLVKAVNLHDVRVVQLLVDLVLVLGSFNLGRFSFLANFDD